MTKNHEMDKTVNIYKELLYISSELIKIKQKVYFFLDLNNNRYFATNCACFLAVKVYAFESVCFYLSCIVNLRCCLNCIHSKITIHVNAIL